MDILENNVQFIRPKVEKWMHTQMWLSRLNVWRGKTSIQQGHGKSGGAPEIPSSGGEITQHKF